MTKKLYIVIITIFWVSFTNAQNDFYDENYINQIEIFFPQSNWDQLMDNYYAAGNGDRLTADSVIVNGIVLTSLASQLLSLLQTHQKFQKMVLEDTLLLQEKFNNLML